MTLDVEVKEGEGGLVSLTFAGELDISRADQVEREIERVEEKSPQTIVFDLRGLEFMDSTGLRLILGADSRARREGRRLLIVPGPEPVQRVFRITLLDRRLDFVEDAAEIPGDEHEG